LLAATQTYAAGRAAEEDIFQSTNLLRISIEIPDEGIQTLRRSQPRRDSSVKPKALARVSDGSRVYTNVSVQLKGFSSFQPIDGLPGLTLNFDARAPKQKFHGLTKISLNNSLQDPTRLHEKFSRELFAAAGVPVPRADYAVVTLNGRELGVYVLAEGFGKEFLKRHFKRTDGNLYDTGVLQDIDRSLQVSSGKNPTAHGGVHRLIRATREPDPDKRFRVLEAAVDMDRFLSMVAIETMLCHSDSYSMNRNNYRLYHDPSTDKIVFMPHGMDRVLGAHRSSLDLSIVPPMLGMVARATLSTPEGRKRYLDRAGVLFTNLFRPDHLCGRVREIDAKIANEMMNRPVDRRWVRNWRQNHAQDVEDLCGRIVMRAAELKVQFAHLSEILAPAPTPNFDSDGIARIEGWRPKRSPGHPEVSHETDRRGGKQVVHLRMLKSPATASLRAVVSLPAGSYRLAGQIKVTGSRSDSPANFTSLTVLRYSANRFAAELQALDWRETNFEFQVSPGRAPEEIEFICDIRAESPEVWFDANSLRLIRRQN
jgi:hypothetical protein